jgi:hypothetical protein
LLFAKEKKRFWLNICKCGFIPKNIFNILVKLTKNNIPYQECVCFFFIKVWFLKVFFAWKYIKIFFYILFLFLI